MFSELVDSALRISGRTNFLDGAVRAANTASRIISRYHDWDWDSVEDEIAAPSTAAYATWEDPLDRNRFIKEYVLLDATGCPIQKMRPGKRMMRSVQLGKSYYYASGSSLIINAQFWPVRIYFYRYQPWLKYYPDGARPAVYDPEQGWQGAAVTDITKVTHWHLEKLPDVMLNGTLQIIFGELQSPRQKEYFTKFSNGLREAVRSHGTTNLLSL